MKNYYKTVLPVLSAEAVIYVNQKIIVVTL